MALKKRSKGGKLDRENGTLIEHSACHEDDCGSSDANAIYQMDDGSFSSNCFSCNKAHITVDKDTYKPVRYRATKQEIEENQEMTDIRGIKLEDMSTFPSDNLKDRGLTKATLEFFGVKVGMDDKGSIDSHFYPTFKDNELSGYRVRSRFSDADKEVEKKPELKGIMKNFKGKVGEVSGEVQLFGQHLFTNSNNNKRIFITEGELDAMSVYQMTAMKSKSGVGYPVVSVPSGANDKAIKRELEYLQGFDEIYLCFDSDKVGQELTEKVAKILPVGKVKIMELPSKFKDANDMIKGKAPNKQDASAGTFWSAIWNAVGYSPVGMVSVADMWDSFKNRGTEDIIPFPDSFGELNERMKGIALGEITMIAAPTSAGKSSLLYEFIYNTAYNLDTKIGAIMLESDKGEMLERMMSIHTSTNLADIDDDQRDWEGLRKTFDEIKSNNNLTMVDSLGSMDAQDILDKIEFLGQGLDCKVVLLDPIQLALAGISNDETEEFTAELVKLVKRTNISLVMVSHVRKSTGGVKDISQGGSVTESDVKGSSSLIQTSFNTIIFERDKVNEDEVVRNTSFFTIWKCRRLGKATGQAGSVFYNSETARLEKGMSAEEMEAHKEMTEAGEGGDFDEYE